MVSVAVLSSAYFSALAAYDHGLDSAISAAIGDVSGISGWLIGNAVKLALSKVGLSKKAVCLFIACHVEYYVRNGRFSNGSNWLLSNKCSVCHLKGHNSRNHPHGLQEALRLTSDVFRQLDRLDD
eukprot:m.75958 g.75958  ORF g.75958 m.75958 type:complete len:125 (+) comp12469_c1_seq1:1791-2165(+)